MEPISMSAAVVAEKALEAAVVAETVNEVAINEMVRKMAELEKLNEITTNELSLQILKEPNAQDLQSYKLLFDSIEAVTENPASAGKLLNDLLHNTNLKGQFGEYIMQKQLEMSGEVCTQYAVQLEGVATGNRVDLFLVESTQNMMLKELIVNQGSIEMIDFYVKEGTSAAIEVKNGSLKYIDSLIQKGTLEQQIKAGSTIADQSYLGINGNAALEIMTDNKGVGFIEAIHEAGGKVIIGMPDYLGQQFLLREMSL